MIDKEMLEQLGRHIEEQFEDLEFIGIQGGARTVPDQCLFNCLKTGATISGNSIEALTERLLFVREHYPHLTD